MERTSGAPGGLSNTSESVARKNKTTTPDGPAQRPTEATACLTKPRKPGARAGGNITGWQDAKKFATKHAPGLGLDRCHLIARTLGGRGKATNLVPCFHEGMNTGTGSMLPFKGMVSDAVDGLQDPADAVFYAVTPNYRNGDSTIPESVTMNAEIQLNDGTITPLIAGVVVRNDTIVGGKTLGLGN